MLWNLALGSHYDTATLTQTDASSQAVAVWNLGNVFTTSDFLSNASGGSIPTEELKFAFGAVTEATSVSNWSWNQQTNGADDVPGLPSAQTLSALPAPAGTRLTLQLAGGPAGPASLTLNSFQFGFHNTVSVSVGAGGADVTTGKARFDVLDVTAAFNNASPDLLQLLTTGYGYDTATLTQTNAAGQAIAVWNMGKVYVNSDVLTGSKGGSSVPVETVQFFFGAITQATSASTRSWSELTNSDLTGDAPNAPGLPAGQTLAALPTPAGTSLTLQLAGGNAVPATLNLNTFQLGFHNPTTIGSSNGGAGAGKARFDSLAVTAALSDSSPDRLLDLAEGNHYDTATLTETDASGQTIAVWTMGFVLITSDVFTSTTGGNSLPTEELNFHFAGITEANNASAQSWNQLSNSDADGPGVPSGQTLSALPPQAGTHLTLQLAGGSGIPATLALNTFQFGFHNSVTVSPTFVGTGKAGFDVLDVTAAFSNSSPDLLKVLALGDSYDTATLTETDAAGQTIAIWNMGKVYVNSDVLTGSNGGSSVPVETVQFFFGAITQATGASTRSWSELTNSDFTGDAPNAPGLPAGQTLAALPTPAGTGLSLQLAGGDATPATIDLNSFQLGFHIPVAIASSNGGAGAGKPWFDALDVTTLLNNSSPDHLWDLAMGSHYDTATLIQTNAAGQPIAVWDLGLVFLASDVFTATRGGSGLPTEELKFVFGQATEVTNPNQTSWDIVEQTATGPEGPAPSTLAPLAPYCPTIAVSAGPFKYDGNSHAAGATVTGILGGPVNGSVTFRYYTGPSASGIASFTAPTMAGDYTVVAHFTSTDPNYASRDSTPLTFTVARAALTVTANNFTRIAGEANPTFTVSYDGFVLGQGPSALGGVLSLLTPATTNCGPGTYAITPAGLTSSNYAITFVSGTLTVLSAAQATVNLQTQVDGAGLKGQQKPLDDQLQAALASFQQGKTRDGVNQLQAFIRHVRAQEGKHIASQLADMLVAAAQRIIDALE
jgi:type VI protein secretion system component Hcp